MFYKTDIKVTNRIDTHIEFAIDYLAHEFGIMAVDNNDEVRDVIYIKADDFFNILTEWLKFIAKNITTEHAKRASRILDLIIAEQAICGSCKYKDTCGDICKDFVKEEADARGMVIK